MGPVHLTGQGGHFQGVWCPDAKPTPVSPRSAFLRNTIEQSHKTQKEIARDAGLAHPNVLSMMKTGECKVPIARIPALA
ncbi:hypothetical protein GCM10011363_29060 [Marivita lacus]|uniref:XRE family transcriptional regulator n=1 Tax=Marivita lacus TaxID=1323742 RepID=A0ABQ1KTI6_9RHOB|nr:hypothetical protein GCM10011363_29060 [Marivita lacus]